ncbi:hypothetical protein T4E_9960 [Trichinella pseudospiralis]|uniref:Uncharacterized protein n=1 Tax=Trichinella pseudospiralis TaxID=6337 RepID=A0A0V0Y2Q6_TRIPS|nr:hypothetical protein T4E_9960 [Trichinella pseudospiralis]
MVLIMLFYTLKLFSQDCDAGGLAGSFEKSISETVFIFFVIMLGVRGEKKMYMMFANPFFFEYGFVELTEFRFLFLKGKYFISSRVVRLCHDKQMW